MNRPIKFRAWEIERKRMNTSPHIWAESESGYPHGDTFADLNKFLAKPGNGIDSRYVLMQFTGLLDKNGKEIYEGDVVKNRFGILFQIKWIAWGFEYIALRNGHRKYEGIVGRWGNTRKFDIHNLKAEVIGNIYENPESLK